MEGVISIRKENVRFSKRTITIIILLFGLVAICNGQGDSQPPRTGNKSSFDWSKVIIGGGLGANFGDITIIDISPSIGYRLKENWVSGINLRYLYYEDKIVSPSYRTNIYGGGPFTQLIFLQNLTAYSEIELLSLEEIGSADKRIIAPSWLVGGGYRSAIGGNSFAQILILYDLIQDPNSPYGSDPIFRVNFGFGL